MVRAKFVVDRIERSLMGVPSPKEGGGTEWRQAEVRTVVMRPVSGEAGENAKFWHASPSGEIRLGCANLAAAEAFALGGEYYVDFTPAEAASKAEA